MKRITTLTGVAALLALVGCEAEESTGELGGDGPLYLVHSAVQGNDGRVNYFTLTDNLHDPRTLDYAQSLEIPGRARLYAEPGVGFFAIGDGVDLTITRYELSQTGQLVAGPKISLQGYGVTSMGAQAVLFISATKAYYKDDTQGQIIVWNPTEMTVDKVIHLPDTTLKEGHYTGLSDWVKRSGEAFFAVGWYAEAYDRVLPGSLLVRIDTDTDQITTSEDSRCRGLNTAGLANGVAYFFSDVINAFGHAVYPDDGGQQDCILRVQPGAGTFDPSYLGTLSGALPEGTAAAAMALTPSGQIWAQVVELATAPTTPGTTYGEWYGAGWTWWHMPVETLTQAVSLGGEPGAYSGFTLATGARFFVSQTAADYSQTTLVNLAGDGPEPGLSFPGFTLDVAQIR